MAIGEAVAGHSLVTGGSGIALGLPENFRRAGLLGEQGSGFTPARGRGAVLSGSCSTASLAQVEAYLRSHPGLAVAADDLMSGRLTVGQALEFFRAHGEEAPLVYSTADPARVRAAQSRHGREAVAGAIEAFFGEARRGARRRRRVAAGGRRRRDVRAPWSPRSGWTTCWSAPRSIRACRLSPPAADGRCGSR